jgi:hypothetical protein
VRFTNPSSDETTQLPSSAYAFSATLSRHKVYSIADSGANVSVTNPSIARQFGLQPQPWSNPFTIVFGNNSEFRCTHFVDFGPILGRVAIVDNAPDTLVSIGALAARGFETRFNSDLGVGLFFQNQLLYPKSQTFKPGSPKNPD